MRRYSARRVVDHAAAELVVDAVDDPAVGLAGHEHVEAVDVPQPADVEVLLHRVAGREQADGIEAVRAHRLGGGVGDVDERDVEGGGDRVGDLVHRVGAEHDQLGAGGDQGRGLRGEQRAGLVPAARALESSTSVKSTDRSRQSAECRPPSRSRVASLTSR